MDLCVLAHRGEAQIFIKGLKNISPNFYQGEDYAVLICGEGVFEASKLGAYVRNFDRVLNFGIAGALEGALELEKIYPIRTHYLHENDRPQFKSFTSLIGELDCITSFNRVFDDEFANELSMYAQIVDREAWLMAKICSDHNKEFQSYKLISDYAGSLTQCFDIKDKALDYSQALFDFYQSIESKSSENRIDLELPGSFTQQKRIEKLLKSLASKQDKTAEELAQDIPKLKTKTEVTELIIELEKKVNPLQANIQKQIQKFQTPFTQIGAQLLFDPKLEKKKFKLQMEINDPKNIENLIEVLQKFKFSELEKFWNGDV